VAGLAVYPHSFSDWFPATACWSFIQWAWSYFTYERGARLITGSTNLPGGMVPFSGAAPANTNKKFLP
jgi:hypothetical protein